MRRMLRHVWKHAFLYCLLLFFLLVMYSRFIEIRWVTVSQVPVQLSHLPSAYNGMQIALLSDLHYPDYMNPQYFERVVRMTNALHPDLVVLAGDYVPGSPDDIEPCAGILGKLHAPMGIYAVFGNHDYWIRSTGKLSRTFAHAGITVLRNKSVPLSQKHARLWLVGLDDFWAGSTNLDAALKDVPRDEEKILLIHEPDFATTYAGKNPTIELQLSGHSHGGQVRLPFIGGVHYPPFSETFPIGLAHSGSLHIYTSRGVGVILPFRLGCRPEITLLILHSP